MSTMLIYSVKVAAVMAVFFACYRIFLRKENFFKINRVVLLTTVFLSFLLPLCVITVTKVVQVEQLQLLTVDADLKSNESVDASIWWLFALGIYLFGFVGALGYNVYSLISVGRIIGSSKKYLYGGNLNLYVIDKDLTPFSWFNSVVMSQSDYVSCDREVIIAHERAHISLWHCYDLLFVNFVCVVQWFNPVIWMLRKDLVEIHEYEADRAVLQSGYNVKSYQLLLLKKAVCVQPLFTTHNLNRSTINNRINMMLQHKQGRVVSRFKLLYIVPLLALALAVFSKTETIIEQQTRASKKVIQIAINSASEVTFGQGSEQKSFGTDFVALEQYLKSKIGSNSTDNYVVQIKADPNIKMGVITSVKSLLYESGLNTFNYSALEE